MNISNKLTHTNEHDEHKHEHDEHKHKHEHDEHKHEHDEYKHDEHEHEHDYDNYYFKHRLRMIYLVLVLVGALNWGIVAYNQKFNLVTMLSNYINSLFNKNYPIDKIIYVLVAVSALLLLVIDKHIWLPFLGPTVLPNSVVPLKTPIKSDMKIKIKTHPNAKVVYWAALTHNENENVHKAYGDYSNSGVVMADTNGNAELSFLESSGYIVPHKGHVERHVHYRAFGKHDGWVGPVKTVFY
jgi:uncharacterized membrane protein YuzA (DUF378 family)